MSYRAKALAIKDHGGKNLYLDVRGFLCLKRKATIFETKEQAEEATKKHTLYHWIIEEE